MITSYPIGAMLNCVIIEPEANVMFLYTLLLILVSLTGIEPKQRQEISTEILVELLTTISIPYTYLV